MPATAHLHVHSLVDTYCRVQDFGEGSSSAVAGFVQGESSRNETSDADTTEHDTDTATITDAATVEYASVQGKSTGGHGAEDRKGKGKAVVRNAAE